MEENKVLDAFIYLTQEFSDPLSKKLAMQFMEINNQIFKNFTPT